VWATGVLLFVMLSGVFPFVGKTDDAMAANIVENKVVYTADAWRDVPEPVLGLLNALLHPVPSERLTVAKASAQIEALIADISSDQGDEKKSAAH
jgi:serine/threonine protein kinase